MSLTARDVMVSPPFVLPQTATVEDVARSMVERRIGCIPIVHPDGRLAGIVTEADFTAEEDLVPFSALVMPKLFGEFVGRGDLQRIYADARGRQVSHVMSRHVTTARPDEPIEDVVERMLRENRQRAVVVQDGRPVGVIARRDLLALVLRQAHPGTP